MLYTIACCQIGIFALFYFLEISHPATHRPAPKHFNYWWTALNIFSVFWTQLALYAWIDIDAIGYRPEGHPALLGMALYVVYSFINYWAHRIKHSNRFLWHTIHKLHHSPSNMVSKLAFYRHPFEILFNTFVIFIFGKLLFNLPYEVVGVVLLIEGSLECFHHSNIKTPKKLLWIRFFIQTPEMHLVHHEYGKHRSNYAPFLWDTIFGTAEFPRHQIQQLGFKNSHTVIPFLFFTRNLDK